MQQNCAHDHPRACPDLLRGLQDCRHDDAGALGHVLSNVCLIRTIAEFF
jgi:hypothetical protein